MATRNAPNEDLEVIINGDFETQIARIRREVLELFEHLHSTLDDKKEGLLGELNRLIAINERNRDAEQAIRQLEAAMESIILISINSLRDKKEQYSARMREDIAEYKGKICNIAQVETMEPIYCKQKFDDAIQSIRLSSAKVEFADKPRILADGGSLKRPRGLAVHNSNIFIADRFSNCVKVFSIDGEHTRLIGDGKNQLSSPWGVAVFGDFIYVTDVGQTQLSKFRISGELVKKSGAKGHREGEFMNARGLFANQEAVYVCDQGNNRVQTLSHDLAFSSVIANTELKSPVDIFVRGKEIIVLLMNENKLILLSKLGELLRVVKLDTEHKKESYFFAVNTKGYFFISSRLDGCIKTFSPEGRFKQEIGRGYANDCYGVSIIGEDGDGIVCVGNASENGCIHIYN